MRRDHFLSPWFPNWALALQLVSVATLALGCADGDERRISPQLVAVVQVSKIEPGSACEPLGALEGHSADDSEDCGLYESAYDSLRTNAALRGGNYVVIDAVDTPHHLSVSAYDPTITIRGRVYACPLGTPYVARVTHTPAKPATTSWSTAPTAYSSSERCEPACGPEFICVRGSCVAEPDPCDEEDCR
jgi:hypothetical protein